MNTADLGSLVLSLLSEEGKAKLFALLDVVKGLGELYKAEQAAAPGDAAGAPAENGKPEDENGKPRERKRKPRQQDGTQAGKDSPGRARAKTPRQHLAKLLETKSEPQLTDHLSGRKKRPPRSKGKLRRKGAVAVGAVEAAPEPATSS